jgi:FkbM family methyltransferase
MSKKMAGALAGLVRAASAWQKPNRRASTQALVCERLAPTVRVETAAGPLHFSTPSARAVHDPANFGHDEPETVRWIDGLPGSDVLWDIGANTGTYALYAAKARGMRVLAFEPSAASYAALVRNVEINALAGLVDSYCLAFDERTRLDHLHMAHTEAGHSLHAFGQDETIGGKLASVFRQSVPGFSVDGFCDIFAPPPPQHIKLDVDSIELAILRGAVRTLVTQVKSLLVEIDGADPRPSGIREFLAGIGFVEDQDFMAGGARRNVLFRRR